MPNYILVETAMGYGLFQIKASEEVASNLAKVQKSVQDYKYVSDMAKLASFVPFDTPEHGLENMNSISEGILHEFLSNFLESNITDKKSRLGVQDKTLASAIHDALKIQCYSNDSVIEMSRAIRLHLHKYLEGVKLTDVEKAQLGLGHAYSRAKVKFNVNKADNMIIQTIAMVDQLDKDLNTFAMRLREWYAWHFPEMSKIVKDNVTYAKLVKLLKDKQGITNDMLHAITEVTGDEKLAEDVLVAAKSSMGLDVSEFDMLNIEQFANKVISLYEYRKQLYEYLQAKMHTVAPNLTVLLGEQVAARLIAHSGSVVNLSKCPASTIQILGAEKALFRALKTKSKTPKYGLIYHSSFIGKASKQNKGKISRYLANKCSIAVRMDAFSDFPTTAFGENLKKQVEDRLNYYENGGQRSTLKKNVDVMREAIADAQKDAPAEEPVAKKDKKDKKRKLEDADEEAPAAKKQKKDKKDKKKKDEEEAPAEEEAAVEETPSKKSKKDKKEKKDKKKKKDEDDEEAAPAEDVEETPSKKSKKDKKDKKKKKDEDDEEMQVEETPSKKDKKEKKEKKDKKKKKKEESSDDE